MASQDELRAIRQEIRTMRQELIAAMRTVSDALDVIEEHKRLLALRDQLMAQTGAATALAYLAAHGFPVPPIPAPAEPAIPPLSKPSN